MDPDLFFKEWRQNDLDLDFYFRKFFDRKGNRDRHNSLPFFFVLFQIWFVTVVVDLAGSELVLLIRPVQLLLLIQPVQLLLLIQPVQLWYELGSIWCDSSLLGFSCSCCIHIVHVFFLWILGVWSRNWGKGRELGFLILFGATVSDFFAPMIAINATIYRASF